MQMQGDYLIGAGVVNYDVSTQNGFEGPRPSTVQDSSFDYVPITNDNVPLLPSEGAQKFNFKMAKPATSSFNSTNDMQDTSCRGQQICPGSANISMPSSAKASIRSKSKVGALSGTGGVGTGSRISNLETPLGMTQTN